MCFSECSKKVKDLEFKVKNAKQLKEQELKEADADVKKCRKAVDASKRQWTDKEASTKCLVSGTQTC